MWAYIYLVINDSTLEKTKSEYCINKEPYLIQSMVAYHTFNAVVLLSLAILNLRLQCPRINKTLCCSLSNYPVVL